MMSEMMKQCCGPDGMPNLEKMKQFMKHCGKDAFSDDELQMMERFCARKEMPDEETMKEMMEKCGCHPSGRAA